MHEEREVRGPDVHPFFLVGVLEVRLRERACPARVEVRFVEPRRFQLEVSW